MSWIRKRWKERVAFVFGARKVQRATFKKQRFHDLTILRSFQCPYVEVATENIVAGAEKLGIDVNIVELSNREELMRLSPTPYGIYAVIYKGQLITFHRLTVHSVIKRLRAVL